MSRNDLVYVRHMLDAMKNIRRYTKGISSAAFMKDTMLQDAVIRNLEVIGEAAKRVPAPVKQRHAQTEGRKISGMRDILIHEYLGVDLIKVWNVVENRLPLLQRQLSRILRVEKAE